MEVRKKIYWNGAFFFQYSKINFLTAMEYKASFFMQIFGMLLNDVALLFFWWALFNRVNIINGWNMEDIFALYALVAAGYGFATGIFGNVFNIPSMITKGELDFYLTLPKSPLLHVLISRMSFSAWGDVLFGFLIYIFLVGTTPARLLIFLLMTIISAFILVSFLIALSSITFYTESGENIFGDVSNALISFSMYPSSIFPPVIKILLYTLLPAAFIGYVPASIVKNFSFKDLLALVVALFVFAFIASIIFNKGLKRYTSGSVLGPRM